MKCVRESNYVYNNGTEKKTTWRMPQVLLTQISRQTASFVIQTIALQSALYYIVIPSLLLYYHYLLFFFLFPFARPNREIQCERVVIVSL